MSLLELIVLLIIAGICGSIAQSMVGFTQRGCFISVITGFIGAIIGTWLARKLSLPDFFVINFGHRNFPVVWSIIGSIIFAAALSAISSRKQ